MDESDEQSAVFPVVLFDGEREMNVGNIKINQTLDFKQFQLMLKQTVGVSYNNLTTYLVDSNKSSSFERRKILITGKVNFSFLISETNCYFLVVLKRSRRDRRKKPNNNTSNKQNTVLSPEYLLHMGRNQFDYGSYGYDDQVQKYMNMVMNWNHVICSPLYVSSFPTVEEAYSIGRTRTLCEDCREADKLGKKAQFHFCVYDDVVTGGGFRSPVGPISRPR